MSRSLRSLFPNRRLGVGAWGSVPGERAQPTQGRRLPIQPIRSATALAALALGAALASRGLRRVEVRGPSMLPLLEEGDRLLLAPAWWMRVGEVVVLREPGAPGLLAVKRVAAIGPAGVEVLGDNPAGSVDSRAYGPVPRTAVVGRAWWRYHPPERAGRLARPPAR